MSQHLADSLVAVRDEVNSGHHEKCRQERQQRAPRQHVAQPLSDHHPDAEQPMSQDGVRERKGQRQEQERAQRRKG